MEDVKCICGENITPIFVSHIKYYPACKECGIMCKECFKKTYENNYIFKYFFQYLKILDKKYEIHVYKTQSCINCDVLPPK